MQKKYNIEQSQQNILIHPPGRRVPAVDWLWPLFQPPNNLNMDYSIARSIPTGAKHERVSTEEIKNGLERIKKAQEQVLDELRKNHQDQAEFDSEAYQYTSEFYHKRTVENQQLKRQLTIEKDKSNEKSVLYRRRVVDLESSLAIHEQNEDKLKRELQNKQSQLASLRERVKEAEGRERELEKQVQSLRRFQQKNRQLDTDYTKLLQETEKSTRYVRKLELEILALNEKNQQNNAMELKGKLLKIEGERDAMMMEKVQLLKNNSRLESEYLMYKQKYALMEKQLEENALRGGGNYRKVADILIEELNIMNQAHQAVFQRLKKIAGRLDRGDLEEQQKYQNSLNKVTEILQKMQENSVEGVVSELQSQTRQERYAQELQRKEDQFRKAMKVEALRFKTEKQALKQKLSKRDIQMEQLKEDSEQMERKLEKLKQQKKEYLKQISSLTKVLEQLKKEAEDNVRKRSQSDIFRQKNQDAEYQEMIKELTEQMGTIKKQKRDLDTLLSKIASNQNNDDQKARRKINQILTINEKMRGQNERIKQKYESMLVEKEHLYLQNNELQRQAEDLMKKLTIEVMQKEQLNNQITALKRENGQGRHEATVQSKQLEQLKKQVEAEKEVQIEMNKRFQAEADALRKQIQISMLERQQLKQLRAQHEMALRENSILGKRSRQANEKIDHLWSIKEVEYQNLNQVLMQMRP